MEINKKPAMQVFREMKMFELRDISPDSGGGPSITVQRVPGGHIYSTGNGVGRWNAVFVPEPTHPEIFTDDPSEWCVKCGMRKQHSEEKCVRCDHPFYKKASALLDKIEKEGLLVDSKALEILKQEYDGEYIIDIEQDIGDAIDSRFNNNLNLIPQEDGFMKGKFTLTLTWEPEEE